MSIDINWDTLTGGPDGAALAESIRAFVHDRFQQVPLPRMLRSVNVHTFDFGSTPPDIELKDVCDPLPDFYDDDQDGNDIGGELSPGTEDRTTHGRPPSALDDAASSRLAHGLRSLKDPDLPRHPLRVLTDGLPAGRKPPLDDGLLPRSGTPRFVGGTSNLGYFHLPLSAGLSGTSTPLAAVASGAQYSNWLDPQHHHYLHAGPFGGGDARDRTTSFGAGSVTPPSRPTSQHQEWQVESSPAAASTIGGGGGFDGSALDSASFAGSASQRNAHLLHHHPEPSPDDLQVVARISYTGDVRLSLTCEILLDYPMESFVGIPLQLNITGLTFNGVAVLAYVRRGLERKAHFCFLAPEDADALVGRDGEDVVGGQREGAAAGEGGVSNSNGFGGLIEEIKVESEIGQKEGGRQVLKNVGKVEKFILEQVRRIFEEEFVYPSFWTFLV